QAEDGIRDDLVTGVQTCALPILDASELPAATSITVQGCRITTLLPAKPSSSANESVCSSARSSSICSTTRISLILRTIRAMQIRSEERRVGKEYRSRAYRARQ